MRLLLDTHALLWWTLGDARLSRSALSVLVDPANELHLSSASGFEIAVKAASGKLKLPTDVDAFVGSALRLGRVSEVPVTLRHTYRVAKLPLVHRDPFDRLLVAVALEEGFTLVTADPAIKSYPVATHW